MQENLILMTAPTQVTTGGGGWGTPGGLCLQPHVRMFDYQVGAPLPWTDTLFCYTVMQKEFFKKNHQTTMLQFFKKTPVEDVVPEEDVNDPVEAVEAEDDDVLD
ncbi:hypothetical protein E2C01_066842 [Portunus trituberculatus]|uniref:Uncharacterized protein n=1 Tax=Portunus trituberculatus TaxID=210409 RepID=A0A5B7HMM1_PORTR|nr:hypothetical protein [Portunus trituberculatus]